MIEVINSVLNEIGDSVGKWLGQEINWMTLESITFEIATVCSNFDLSNSGYINFAIANDPGADITDAIEDCLAT